MLAPNKTLAAQLYGEMKSFFPNNAVEYFVSYYDYYQPEAYVPRTDTYIEKDASINEQIDRMRHSATRSLLERRDVVIVASVSCIYGIGSPETYSAMTLYLDKNSPVGQRTLLKKLVELQYRRNNQSLERGDFRVRGDVIEVFPAHSEDRAWRISMFGNDVEEIVEFDPLTGHKTAQLDQIRVYPNSHYVTPRPTINQAIKSIRAELAQRLEEFQATGQLLAAERLEQRTLFDLEMMEATGSCAGIENYSRYLTGRNAGEPPPTLFEYLPENALLVVDESHVTVPQLNGMYRGDFKRKSTLAEFGFRLPSCIDNRPLKFEEWEVMRPQTVFVSATPGPWEMERTAGVFVEQVIRPTGLIDPVCLIRPVEDQVDDLMSECRDCVKKGALSPFRRRHPGAHRDHPRSSPRRLRRAGRHQSVARGPGYTRMWAGGDFGRRQRRLPTLAHLAHPDHRPRRSQHRRPRHSLRRQYDQFADPSDRGNRPPAHQTAGI